VVNCVSGRTDYLVTGELLKDGRPVKESQTLARMRILYLLEA